MRPPGPEEGVQAYGGSYSSVTSSGGIRYEFGVMRFPCNETAMSDGFEKQILATTVPRCVHASDVSFEICVSQVVKSLFSLSRQLRLLPSLCENAVKSGLA